MSNAPKASWKFKAIEKYSEAVDLLEKSVDVRRKNYLILNLAVWHWCLKMRMTHLPKESLRERNSGVLKVLWEKGLTEVDTFHQPERALVVKGFFFKSLVE